MRSRPLEPAERGHNRTIGALQPGMGDECDFGRPDRARILLEHLLDILLLWSMPIARLQTRKTS
jgi:hypothetical protein